MYNDRRKYKLYINKIEIKKIKLKKNECKINC
jgi:hypothetical protein